ncbi:hypothetical protein BDE36_4232 [Arcticibacter tournemirensis]|nr:hypothetical protein BDE36_4232 [Arcticibacter tournemirensis]
MHTFLAPCKSFFPFFQTFSRLRGCLSPTLLIFRRLTGLLNPLFFCFIPAFAVPWPYLKALCALFLPARHRKTGDPGCPRIGPRSGDWWRTGGRLMAGLRPNWSSFHRLAMLLSSTFYRQRLEQSGSNWRRAPHRSGRQSASSLPQDCRKSASCPNEFSRTSDYSAP